MTNRFILGPDDVRRTAAEHAAAFPARPARVAPAATAPESKPASAPAAAAPDDRASIHKPTKGQK